MSPYTKLLQLKISNAYANPDMHIPLPVIIRNNNDTKRSAFGFLSIIILLSIWVSFSLSFGIINALRLFSAMISKYNYINIEVILWYFN